MEFLYEKQNRRYIGFLGGFCIMLILSALLAGSLQARGMKNVLLKRERMIVSSLLFQEVEEEVIAAACKNEAVTAEGSAFLERIGWSQSSDPKLLPAVREQAMSFGLLWLSAAIGLSALLLAGSVIFLKKREKLYREAAAVIAEFAAGNFTRHLCRDEEGMLYQMFAAVDQLAKALQARGEMAVRAKEVLQDAVSDISHQLKTPLAALSMYAEIMRDEPDNPETVKRFAEKSLRSLTRTELLIQTLLKVMRLDAAEELRTRAVKEKKQLITKGDPQALLCCDRTWTAEAISNLIKNALDHTKEGGTIQICWQQTPALLRLWVKDDGCGIAPEDMPHIFKRFYKSSRADDTRGAGLGLALAKSIVERQGGVLSVVSKPGEGAAFTITFAA